MLVPVPVVEGVKLLEQYEGNIASAEHAFKNACLLKITNETGCSITYAEENLMKFKFDIQRVISKILEENYDQNYKQNQFITLENIEFLYTWINYEANEDLYYALTCNAERVFEILQQIPTLHELEIALRNAREKQILFHADLTDGMSFEKKLEITNRFRQDQAYKNGREAYRNYFHILERELSRHYRNLRRIASERKEH
jgi:hypothetical protein